MNNKRNRYSGKRSDQIRLKGRDHRWLAPIIAIGAFALYRLILRLIWKLIEMVSNQKCFVKESILTDEHTGLGNQPDVWKKWEK